ncbi:MAG TPA: TIGR03118 family protein, partial [Paraburkholderia sp.]
MNMKLKLLNAVALCASLWIGTASAQSYTQTNVDSNVAGAANRFDPQLVEPYGLSRGSSMAWWVSDAGSGVSTLYAGDGSKNPLVVTIPPARRLPPGTKGTPAGTIGNASPSDFLVAGQPAAFLFSSLDGAITAWAPSVGTTPGQTLSTQAELVAMGERGSIYPAIASGFIDGKRYLYAANLGLGRIDVYDSKFRAVRLPRGNPQP